MPATSYQFVSDLWDPAKAAKLSPVERLIYRSNLLGSDPRITNTRGGNTSLKCMERDPLTGEQVEVMWVKGSGGDLRSATVKNFASLYQHKLLALQKVYTTEPGRGPKTPLEDSMVARYGHCIFNLNPCVPSIDTPLHSFIPHRHVDHTHPNAVIALAAASNASQLCREVYGNDVLWTPWQRPGFDLGMILQETCKRHPQAKGIILGQHGIINWADDDEACYRLTLDLIEKAAKFLKQRDKKEGTFNGARFQPLAPEKRREALLEILPWLRGQLGQRVRQTATWDDGEAILEFVNSKDAARLAELGTSCPDHFLRTKIRPLLADWDPATGLDQLKASLQAGLEAYRKDYTGYYQRGRVASSPAMRDPNPTIVLIPGLGMIAWGKDKVESRVTGEFYLGAVEVMRGAESAGKYSALSEKEAFEMEYWLLEEVKLKLLPPEKELSRRILAVVGAGSGIGKETASRLAAEGAQVLCADLNAEAARAVASELAAKAGPVLGACGKGASDCGPFQGFGVDAADRGSIRRFLEECILAYGGLDGMAITAGVFVPPDVSGEIPDEKWALTFTVNVKAPYFLAGETNRLWKSQGLKASLVLCTSANAVVPKVGSVAYDTSKAAANHLVRELALMLAPLVRVNGVAPATVLQGSTMFPRDRIIASLAKYKLPYGDADSTETLASRLGEFYASRTLTRAEITPADQAEAIFLLLGSRLSKTTGQVVAVDGGLADAFLR
jgi:rhamnulose-1-phosphate aldolase/alcohol dehydrogenase